MHTHKCVGAPDQTQGSSLKKIVHFPDGPGFPGCREVTLGSVHADDRLRMAEWEMLTTATANKANWTSQ